MFVSFFPRPPLFIVSAAIWAIIVIALWYGGGNGFASDVGLFRAAPGDELVGASLFWSPAALWFYVYYWAAVLAFFMVWRTVAPHPWALWSILGSALILFTVYLQVQVSVAVNSWYGPFYDLVQAALSKSAPVTLGQFYGQLATFAGIAAIAVTVGVFTRFFVSHYVFRWRTAMNGYYMQFWPRLRTIEGASQRIQEDTMRFASTMEGLGVGFIGAVMTLIAFLPVLFKLSLNVSELPLVGEVPQPLVLSALAWALFGTAFLAVIGIRLPGLEFRNQRVEAAYRKELVLGEDDAARAAPPTIRDLFSDVRRNYFRLYINYLYFNIGRIFYLQVDNIFPYIILAPTIVAGKITLGVLNQILNSFDQVRSSFQYLVNAWTTIVELVSIYKRLRGFEAAIGGEPAAYIDEQAQTSFV